MKVLILATTMSAITGIVGSDTAIQAKNSGEPLIYVKSWNDLTCIDTAKNIVIRLDKNEKTISVTCE